MADNIIATYWFTEGYHPHHFGMVKVKNEVGKVRYFIGFATGRDERSDAETISHWGAEIDPQEAKAFFADEIPEPLRSKEIRDPA